MRGAVEHVVVRGFSVLTLAARLVVAADQEDRVIGGRRDGKRHQQVDREGGEAEDVVIGQHGHDAAGRQQAGHHQHQHDAGRHHGAVDDQQHDDDDRERHQLDGLHAGVADHGLIGAQRRRARHVDVQALGSVVVRGDFAHRGHRLVGQRLALLAGDIDLHVGGLVVDALGAGGGQRVAPEVLHVLDVLGVGLQPVDHVVVEGVRLGAERLVTLQHDHHRAGGVVLVEHLADALGGDLGGGVGGAHRDRAHLADLVELRHNGVEHRDDGDPGQDDRDGEGPQEPRDEGLAFLGPVSRGRDRTGGGLVLVVVDGGAHAAFTRQ